MPTRGAAFDNTTVKLTAKMFQRVEGAGDRVVGDGQESATAEKINPSYVRGVLRFTLLASDRRGDS